MTFSTEYWVTFMSSDRLVFIRFYNLFMVSRELQLKLLGSAFSRVIFRDEGVHHMLTLFRIFELSDLPEDM